MAKVPTAFDNGDIKQKKDMSNPQIKEQLIASGLHEFTQRYGEAGSQFLIGLRGIDHETGKILDRGLSKISNYNTGDATSKLYANTIKAQAGYSAEVASVSKHNAEAIIKKNLARYARSEDVAGFGKNHTTVDIVELLDGKVTKTSQMKFKNLSGQKTLLRKIAKGEGGGSNDLSRYLKVDLLEVPTEQVEQLKEICRREAESLEQQAYRMKIKGKTELADKLQQQSDNYKILENKISDSGLTTEEAIRYRLNPKWETTKDIANISHQAGLEGAKFGAVLGGSISLITNIIAVNSGKKELSDAVWDSTKSTFISGTIGYSTAFSGTALKAYMQQSSKVSIRTLSKTGLPSMIISTCLDMGRSITKYAKGEINESEMAHEIGLTASGTMSAAVFTTIGQFAIPIPILGAMIGSIVGYTLTNTFYQSFFDVLKEKKLSDERRQIIEMQCLAAQIVAKEYQQAIHQLFREKFRELDKKSKDMFAILDNPNISAEEFCIGMNRFADLLGKKISINNMADLDDAMNSNDPLSI